MKKVLVTGYDGYIGSLLIPLLREKGFQPVGLDTSYFDSECEFYPHEKKDDVIIIRRDIRQIEAKDLEGVDAVCHLAALSNDTLGQINPELTYDINHQASVTLARKCKEYGVSKYIYSSSCSLYGKAGGDEALTEEAGFDPITAYAKSKVYTERDVMPLGDSNFCVTFLRNATAYGISPKLRLDIVANNLVGWAVTTGQIKIMSDGTPWRPLVHAEDIARAFIAVIEAPSERVNQQAFNVGQNAENYMVKDIARIVGEVIPGCDVIFTGEHGDDSRSYRVDFSKIKRFLPEFKPQWMLRKGVEQLFESYKRNGLGDEKFNGRYFIRLRQIRHLMDSGAVDKKLYWR